MKEGLEASLEALQSRKDDLLTIGEMGVDQIDRRRDAGVSQAFVRHEHDDAEGRRSRRFAARLGSLCQNPLHRREKNPGRALIPASGTPITNTLGELFTLQRFMQPDALEERGIQEFDAWAATFGDTRTELELQPSGLYKPVTRFSEFVNVPDLMAIYRMVADVVLQVRPSPVSPLAHDQRPATPDHCGSGQAAAFNAYQRHLAERIEIIEQRTGKPKKGDDILLCVIADGRHAAIDLRFVRSNMRTSPKTSSTP